MIVSEVNIAPIKPRDGLVAFASCVVNNEMFCGSIAVYARPNGSYRILYPAKKMCDSDLSIYHPINRDASKAIEEAICKKCEEIFKKCNEGVVYGHDSITD